MKRIATGFFVAAMAMAQTGTRITPPTLRDISPRGVARGTTVEITIEGFNLAKTSQIFFNQPGLTGRILRVKELPDLPEVRLGSNGTAATTDLGPLPTRNQVTVEVDVDPDASIGEVAFRLRTPLGTSPEGSFLVEPYFGESPDKEPNDTIDGAFETFLPTILVGAISKPGDVDHFKLNVKAGQTLVFDNGGMQIGSTLQPVVAILDSKGDLVAEYGTDGGRSAAMFAHTFANSGVHYARISDYEKSGRSSNTYRIKVGEFAVVTGAFPLGLKRGAETEIKLAGYNLPASAKVKGERSADDENLVLLRPKASFNQVKLALNDDAEVAGNGKNYTPAAAQRVDWPVTVNGLISAPGSGHYYRFTAKKDQPFVIDVNAKRLGSELDSEIEVLDVTGKPVEMAVVRPVMETNLVLRDHDSSAPGLRIQSWTGMAVGDYMQVGREVLRIDALPRGPDDDMQFDKFGGQRLAYFNTSSEAHAIDKPVYKVQMHPAHSRFTPNGLPLTRLYYRNDDGGPVYGKDSRVDFTAPADGDYLVRITDVRGMSGPEYAYRLSIRQPRPDFRIVVNPKNPNVPSGGVIPLTVTAMRMDGFDGPIAVELADLPQGLKATKSVIGAGQVSVTLLLSAEEGATATAELKVIGKAGNISHWANPEDRLKLISVTGQADVLMVAQTPEVTLEPGGTAEIKVKITRQNGFGGRVPVQVMNLPPRVRVLDVGLNGVLLNEDETERSFTIEALDSAQPVEQLLYVAGAVETRSPQQNLFASWTPVLVKVKARAPVVAAKDAVARSGATR